MSLPRRAILFRADSEEQVEQVLEIVQGAVEDWEYEQRRKARGRRGRKDVAEGY